MTTVLESWPKGYGFTQWLKDLGHNADEVVKRAGEQGSNVHNLIDLYIKGNEVSWVDASGNPKWTLDEWQMFLKFVEFWETHKPEVITNEESVVVTELSIGGTIDLVCRINGVVWLIDFKTSNAIHTSYELQIAAYATMWNIYKPDFKIERCGIMWLKSATRGADKKGEKIQGAGWCVKEFERHYSEAFKLFQYCQAIWNEEHPTYKPKNLVLPAVVKMGGVKKDEN